MRTATSSLFRFAISVLAALTFVQVAPAQTVAQRKDLLKKMLDASSAIPDAQKRLLSSGARNFYQLARQLTAPPPASPGVGGVGDGGLQADVARTARVKAALLRPVELAAGPGGVARVSDPGLDFQLSLLEGFTQSETSTAWCGNNVVVGYDDSGGFLRTNAVNPQAASSLNGVSASANGGNTFKDVGFLNPGANPMNFLAGDPVVFCTSASRFYYSSLLETTTTDAQGHLLPTTAVSVSSSFDGGLVWGNPVIAAGKDANTHILDKPWSTYDPANPLRLYVTYTDIDFSGVRAGCPDHSFVMAIEMVSSTDGGGTWSAPTVVDQVCDISGGSVHGSNVVVAPDGSVYVAYELIPAVGAHVIHIAHSTNHGGTFGKIVTVDADVVPNGAVGDLQGRFETNEFPQLAVDRSSTPSRGTLYVVWTDGRNNVVPDVVTGTYAYPDVVIAKSTDGGVTFSTPLAVSPTPATFAGTGRDQFFPGVAVDKDGNVGVCYYDRRGSADNTVIDRFCSVSLDQGGSWGELRVSNSNWLPVNDTDFLSNSSMGEYDALTSDALGINGGFIGAFEILTGGNPDVYAKRF